MPYQAKDFKGGSYMKAWMHEMRENKLRGVQAQNAVFANGPQHYERIWKQQEEQKRKEEAERRRRSEERQKERERQEEIKRQEKLRQEKAEREREERARIWREEAEKNEKLKEKLEKETPSQKPKPKPKEFGDCLKDNLADSFGIDNDGAFDAHKVKPNLYETVTKVGLAFPISYAEHKYHQKKMYRWAQKGYGPHNKTSGDLIWEDTSESAPWKVCEYDNWKMVTQGAKKAFSTGLSTLLITKNPYAAGLGSVFSGASGIIDEKEKQDVKMHECEKNKTPKL